MVNLGCNETPPETFRCAEAETYLSKIDECWSTHVARTGACTLTTKPTREPYEALIRAVAYQQLTAKAGDSILGRLTNIFSGRSFPSPEQLLSCESSVLRSCGFSLRKALTIHEIAQAAIDGVIPALPEAHTCSDHDLITRLTSISGVGKWTVEMALIYTLGRPDVLPTDDFGVREGYRRLKKLQARPSASVMEEVGADWSPYRTVATWYLWRVPKH
ncbi:DNA-3-methyladenine glycosylase family protein [Pseudomonas oryzihabitans]|uniref:DNA-3-methyladenine glycosylase family protein n=1 Tax=Pseudomonas oryzihabitans TaxID=47885 RepID=UPI0009DE4322|nr:DNA-3-methyladenine glycosylase [Pseudomonas oryzihabitans]NMZ44243.1 DNA-3-methyladenine glycosylase 2 family protein [Pseudomonas oryzihabitans]